jgi:hypothetical protein
MPVYQDDGLEARYANTFRTGYNRDEFIIDAGQSVDNAEHFYLRIVSSPCYALELSRLLTESLERYREAYGPIAGPEEA